MSTILVLTPQLPYPPQQGTTLRNFNLIAGLARRGHVIDLATFLDPHEQACDAGPLVNSCRSIVTAPKPAVRGMARRARDTLMQRLPDMALRLESTMMHGRVAEVLARNTYDVVQVEGIEMAPYALKHAAAVSRSVLVFDDHNAEYVLQQRTFQSDVRRPKRWPGALYSFIQWQKLVRYERQICALGDRVAAVSDTDRAALQRMLPGLDPAVVPNGVDLDVYRPGAAAPAPGLGPAALVFTGKMDYRPNVDAVLWFADQVLPLIRQRTPEAHFYVVGQQPHARLAALKTRPDVTLTGWVPDVRPYMAGAAVYVVPLNFGGGTRLKVLEAMAMGLPIVSTHLGCDGFSFADGRELRFADDPPAFASLVVELLRDRAQAARLGQTARDYVAAHFGWDAIVPLMEQLYRAPARRAAA